MAEYKQMTIFGELEDIDIEKKGKRAKTFEDYEGFVKKFEVKKTTDDCYTPPMIYEIVKDWTVKRFGLNGVRIIRPFKPGGDFINEDYSGDCVVIDNPPFSILKKYVIFITHVVLGSFCSVPRCHLYTRVVLLWRLMQRLFTRTGQM